MVLMNWQFEILSKDKNECICGPSNVGLFGSHLIMCPKSQEFITPSRSERDKQLILKWQKAFFNTNPS